MDSTPNQPEFTPFRRLPIELRLKIWKHYHEDTTEPQLITVRLYSSAASGYALQAQPCLAYHHLLALKQTSIPTILQVCAESRLVGLSHLKLGFDVQNHGTDSVTCPHQHASEKSNMRSGKSVYWDPNKDIVHVELGWAPPESTMHIWGGSHEPNLQDVRYLALSDINLFAVSLANLGFDNLRTIYMVSRVPEEYYDVSGPEHFDVLKAQWLERIHSGIRSPTKAQFMDKNLSFQPTIRVADSLKGVVEHLAHVSA